MINAKGNRPKSLAQWLCELPKPRRPTPIVRNNPHWIISFHERRHEQHLAFEEHERGRFGKIKPSNDSKRGKCRKDTVPSFRRLSKESLLTIDADWFSLGGLAVAFPLLPLGAAK